MTNENEENKIETAEFAWKINRGELYSRLSERINEKLNQAIQELEYCDLADSLVLSFPSYAITKHFANQLESHGWVVTLDEDDDTIQIDVVASIDQADKDMHVISQAHYFSQDDLDNLN